MVAYQIISNKRHALAESPVWDEKTQSLYWVDILKAQIFRYEMSSETITEWQLGEHIGSIGLATHNRLIVALRSGIYLFDIETQKLKHVVTPAGEPFAHTRFNDGKVSPDGCFFVGTMDERFQELIGKLYAINRQGQAKLVKSGFMVSNGLAWTEDGRQVFHSCSRGQKIWRYDYDSSQQSFHNETLFATPTNQIGRPDGAACDGDGNYWSAGIFAARLNQFNSKGELVQYFDLPMKAPTMPCFGGPDMKTIFITSLTENHSAKDFEDYPLSGAVIAIRVNVAGVKNHHYHYEG